VLAAMTACDVDVSQTMVCVSLLLRCNASLVRMDGEVALQNNAYTAFLTCSLVSRTLAPLVDRGGTLNQEWGSDPVTWLWLSVRSEDSLLAAA
jgi:hypothetical protein